MRQETFIPKIWDLITKHSLVSLGYAESMDDNNSENDLKMEYFPTLFKGILEGRDDRWTAKMTQTQILIMGYVLSEEDLLGVIKDIRNNCELELLVLEIASDLLYEQNEDPMIVYEKVRELLSEDANAE